MWIFNQESSGEIQVQPTFEPAIWEATQTFMVDWSWNKNDCDDIAWEVQENQSEVCENQKTIPKYHTVILY